MRTMVVGAVMSFADCLFYRIIGSTLNIICKRESNYVLENMVQPYLFGLPCLDARIDTKYCVGFAWPQAMSVQLNHLYIDTGRQTDTRCTGTPGHIRQLHTI